MNFREKPIESVTIQVSRGYRGGLGLTKACTSYESYTRVLVGAAGLEPATLCLEGKCSIHLSYAPTFCPYECNALARMNFTPSYAIVSGVGAMSRQMLAAALNSPNEKPKLSIVSHPS